MRIVFVRHGEPDYRNDCLTETGKIQARQAAVRLREEGIEQIFSSPLGRAQETAAAASEELGLPVQTLDFMRELHWGSIDGEPLFANGHPWDIADELARQGWNLNRTDWEELPYFKNNVVTANVRLVVEGIDQWLASLGYILNLPFPYATALLHLEFTGITILRLDRNPGAVSLPCLELGNDGRHIRKGFYHRLENM